MGDWDYSRKHDRPQGESGGILPAKFQLILLCRSSRWRRGCLRQITFHFRTESGFTVITLTNHALSYALVSSVSVPARASCLAGHQNMPDHNDFTARIGPC